MDQIERARERARIARNDANVVRESLKNIRRAGSRAVIQVHDGESSQELRLFWPNWLFRRGNIRFQVGTLHGAASRDTIINLDQPPVTSEITVLAEALAALSIDLAR